MSSLVASALVLATIGGPVTEAVAQEAGDRVLSFSLGRGRSGLSLKVFVNDDVAVELYARSLRSFGLGANVYPDPTERDFFLVASLGHFSSTGFGGGPLDLEGRESRARRTGKALHVGAGLDFGHLVRRTIEASSNYKNTFFVAAGPTVYFRRRSWLERPDGTRVDGRSRPLRFDAFFELGVKTFFD